MPGAKTITTGTQWRKLATNGAPPPKQPRSAARPSQLPLWYVGMAWNQQWWDGWWSAKPWWDDGRSHGGGRRDQWDCFGGHDGEGGRDGASSEAWWRQAEWSAAEHDDAPASSCAVPKVDSTEAEVPPQPTLHLPHSSLSTQPSQPSRAMLPVPTPQADQPSATVAPT